VGEGDRPLLGEDPAGLSRTFANPTRTLYREYRAPRIDSSGTLDEVVALILDELERTQTWIVEVALGVFLRRADRTGVRHQLEAVRGERCVEYQTAWHHLGVSANPALVRFSFHFQGVHVLEVPGAKGQRPSRPSSGCANSWRRLTCRAQDVVVGVVAGDHRSRGICGGGVLARRTTDPGAHDTVARWTRRSGKDCRESGGGKELVGCLPPARDGFCVITRRSRLCPSASAERAWARSPSAGCSTACTPTTARDSLEELICLSVTSRR